MVSSMPFLTKQGQRMKATAPTIGMKPDPPATQMKGRRLFNCKKKRRFFNSFMLTKALVLVLAMAICATIFFIAALSIGQKSAPRIVKEGADRKPISSQKQKLLKKSNLEGANAKINEMFPVECNWECYIDRYPDLIRNLERKKEVAIAHYIKHGVKDGRQCTCMEDYSKYNYRNTAAVHVIQKGGLRYINEWIDYHFALGFDEIYIDDNSDNFELKEWYENLPNRNPTPRNFHPSKVIVKHRPGDVQQLKSNTECIRAIQKSRNHSWVALIDLDEFISIEKAEYKSIMDVLDTVRPDAGGLALNWKTFFTNNQTFYEPLPLTKRFQRAAINPPMDKHVKTIVRVGMFLGMNNPHFVKAKFPAVDTNGAYVEGPCNERRPYNVAAINHYLSKSMEEFRERCSRGKASISKEKHEQNRDNNKYIYCRDEANITKYFESMSKNGEVFDDKAWRFLKRSEPEVYN